MRIKCKHNGLGRKTRGHLPQLGDDRRMPDVHAIEVAHSNHTPRLRRRGCGFCRGD